MSKNNKIKINMQLPCKLLPIKNPDKAFKEEWYHGRELLNIPGVRGIFIGMPGSGKTNNVKNLVVRADPPFEKITVIHVDPGGTKEYDDLKCDVIAKIPDPKEFDGKHKSLVIIDDIDVKALDKQQKSALSRLFGYVSTHKNVSVCITAQNPIDLPPIVRRCANLIVSGKMYDIESMSRLGKKFGLGNKDFCKYFSAMKNPHDSLWIDHTEKSPAPLRYNGYQIIPDQKGYDHSKSEAENKAILGESDNDEF